MVWLQLLLLWLFTYQGRLGIRQFVVLRMLLHLLMVLLLLLLIVRERLCGRDGVRNRRWIRSRVVLHCDKPPAVNRTGRAWAELER